MCLSGDSKKLICDLCGLNRHEADLTPLALEAEKIVLEASAMYNSGSILLTEIACLDIQIFCLVSRWSYDIHVYIGIHVMFMFWVEVPYCAQGPWSVKISRVQWRPMGKLNLYNRLCATHYQLTSCELMTICWRYLSFDHWKSTAGNLLSNFHYCTIFLLIGVCIFIYFLEVLPCLLSY